MSKPATSSGLERAIAQVGSASALAKALGLDRSTVALWRKSRVPAERVPEIEVLTGIPRYQLRPDLWERPL